MVRSIVWRPGAERFFRRFPFLGGQIVELATCDPALSVMIDRQALRSMLELASGLRKLDLRLSGEDLRRVSENRWMQLRSRAPVEHLGLRAELSQDAYMNLETEDRCVLLLDSLMRCFSRTVTSLSLAYIGEDSFYDASLVTRTLPWPALPQLRTLNIRGFDGHVISMIINAATRSDLTLIADEPSWVIAEIGAEAAAKVSIYTVADNLRFLEPSWMITTADLARFVNLRSLTNLHVWNTDALGFEWLSPTVTSVSVTLRQLECSTQFG